MMDDTEHGFTIAVDDKTLDDLKLRLSNTRWPDEISNEDWRYGTQLDYLRSLVTYWATDFDWRGQERWLNGFDHFRQNVDGSVMHYVHARSKRADAIPLLLLHGWPSSFIQMLKLIPLLTNPASDRPAFHVVAASLPGYAFSEPAREPGMNMAKIASLMTRLMRDKLGYVRFAARGSDLGGTVIDQIARHHGDALIGIHLSGIIVAGSAPAPDDATPAEIAFLEASARMGVSEIAYARQHATKPQTLAYGLSDSPAGLAGWIVEKYRAWGDTGGDIESRFCRDYLLTTLTIYWVTNCINASIRLYWEMVRDRGSQAYIDVPTGMLMSHQDLFPMAPREWAERGYNIVHWRETRRGGHFLEWEEPDLVASDMQDFFVRLVK